MIDEKFSQFSETVANCEKAEVSDIVLAQDQSLDTVKILDTSNIFIIDFAMGKIHFLSVWINHQIFDGDR